MTALPTDITVVLDRSGSMGGMRREAIEAFNEFLGEQRGVDGEATISMVQFNHEIERTFEGVEIDDVVELGRADYRPRGMTALLDAMGDAITRTRGRRQAGEDAQVVIVVITDGKENSSREYTLGDIRELVERYESEHGWRFVFLAADLDSVRASRGMGIKSERAFVMGRGGDAHKRSVDLVAKKMAMMRQKNDIDELDFQDEERRRHSEGQ
ncbi:MAG: VWA domain-containing protein [Phycisphaerales bacterium]|nr:VWA domain-containing protein [Phycisphaerales bacterium]